MFETFKNAWKIRDLRRKILYTLMILLVYRLGSFVPVMGVDVAAIGAATQQYSVLGLLDLMTGGSFGQFTIFAMGISPYITASIILQLLTIAIPSMEKMSKEEDGRKKINEITRYAAIGLAMVQAVGTIYGMRGSVILGYSAMSGWERFATFAMISITLSAGTAITMWMGERIDEKGIGNGISLLIFTGITSRVLPTIIGYIGSIAIGAMSIWLLPLMLIGLAVIIVGIVFVDLGVRRVPVQYAKRVVGRKMYGGQSTHIPMKVNSTGVMPLIFAMSIMSFPQIIAQFWPNSAFYVWYTKWLGTGTPIYYIFYALLILFFTYFYTTISFNPVEIAKNMQQNGGFIPGIRPGRPTSDYLMRISNKLTFFGACFLTVLAIVPTVGIHLITGARSAFGPTSLLIMVSVAIETTKQLESMMLMRHYKGFLK